MASLPAMMRRIASAAKRTVTTRVTKVAILVGVQRAVQKYSANDRTIVHLMPEFSGGASNSILAIVEALWDYDHILISDRHFSKTFPVTQRARSIRRVTLLSGLSKAQKIELLERLPSTVVMNHLFSYPDFQITKDMLRRKACVITFLRSQHVFTDTSPEKTDYFVMFTTHLEDPRWSEWCKSNPGNLVVIPNAIDPNQFPNVEAKDNLRGGHFVIGNVTNGAPWKHSDDFVEICKSLRITNARFRFLGAWRLAPHVENDVRFELIKPFTIPTADYHRQISVLMHRTREDVAEIWPRAVAEAMCAGIPVVVDRRGGMIEQVRHGETGFLCDDPDDFVKFLELLASDMALYLRMSKAASVYARAHFTPAALRSNLLSLIKCADPSLSSVYGQS